MGHPPFPFDVDAPTLATRLSPAGETVNMRPHDSNLWEQQPALQLHSAPLARDSSPGFFLAGIHHCQPLPVSLPAQSCPLRIIQNRILLVILGIIVVITILTAITFFVKGH
ncbi:hypothetical protein LEMLEM_LOCUS3768 [Lemmus lemmus]